MSNSIDWTKPIQTKNGKPARYKGTRKSPKMIHCVLYEDGDAEYFIYVNHVGMCYENGYPSRLDIINVPAPKRSGTVWVNVYEGGVCEVHNSRNIADSEAGKNRLACVEVPWTEGQGLKEPKQ